MKALTLHAPWAHAVAWLGKDLENRGWRPPVSVIGMRIAIHAGAGGFLEEWLAIERIVKSSGGAWTAPFPIHATSAIVATAIIGEPVASSPSPWFIGPIGWPLLDVRRLDVPIPMRGNLGLWTLPTDIALPLDKHDDGKAV